MPRHIADLTTAKGVERWIDLCGFATYTEAANAIGINWRTLNRYRKTGLPGKRNCTEAWRNELIARMKTVLADRTS